MSSILAEWNSMVCGCVRSAFGSTSCEISISGSELGGMLSSHKWRRRGGRRRPVASSAKYVGAVWVGNGGGREQEGDVVV
jgi:hypothetical protein